jgi:hypothetical protein
MLLSAVTAASLLTAALPVAADRLTIRNSGDRPQYALEAEPHLNLGLIDPPGIGTGKGIGLGFRATVELVENGFVQTINNSVGLGFGIDYVHHAIGRDDRPCVTWEPDPLDPADADICTEFRESADYFLVPVVMQWNFWLSEEWSVFGEPGGIVYYADSGGAGDDNNINLDISIYGGGRWHFADAGALTMRLGYPTFSVGVSFLL